jgi:hypothetical protein
MSVAAQALSLPERSRLAELEQVVDRGLQTFVEVGEALQEIRDGRLYRETHATFRDYCRDRFGFSDSRGRQLIAAARTVTEVTLLGLPAPANEREARALARLLRAGEPEATFAGINATLRDARRRVPELSAAELDEAAALATRIVNEATLYYAECLVLLAQLVDAEEAPPA